jgi:UDP-glucose 4-epimerase
MAVFVSGATGYIGGAIIRAYIRANIPVFGGTRSNTALPERVMPCVTGDLAAGSFALPRVDTVIHAAGLGHRRGVAPSVWQRANVDAAANLAKAAKSVGAKKFVLISTAHVHGRVAAGVVDDTSPPNPMESYAASKLAAEAAVRAEFGDCVTIIRPTAVIGPNCPGNLQLLMKCLAKGIPLPFAGIVNSRSFIHVDDLARLVLLAAGADSPALLLAAHPESISTPGLVRALGRGMNVTPRLFSLPGAALNLAATLLGRGAMWQSLSGSFVADPRAALQLGWQPAHSLAESLTQTGWYYDTTRPNA